MPDGRSIRFLNITENYRRFSTGISVTTSLPSSRVIEILTESNNQFGKAKSICIDNGPDYRSKFLQHRALKKGISLKSIQPGNALSFLILDSYKGKVRPEI